ncbi:hypothetical protein [Brevundimonas sp.]|uniref:hypothetical protein n=1 Tax=Brevundimonas sp. TaxID=1871086 RepID=UPI00272F0143|nr:hypothetical protein [Brevundimonas sp.]MDP1912548.1 hypothetical protein [Brevundimonas sp.]
MKKLKPRRGKRVEDLVDADFRPRLEAARLAMRALFRALDELGVGQRVPGELRKLIELDADVAECLHVLDMDAAGFDVRLMVRETLSSMERVEPTTAAFLETISSDLREQLIAHVEVVRLTLQPADAYLDIPGRDPLARPSSR